MMNMSPSTETGSLPEMFFATETKQTIYLLLDGAKIDSLAKQVALIDAADEVIPIYAGTRLQEASEVSPLLVQVSSLSPFADFLQHDENRDGCLIIESTAGFETLLQYWQAQLFAVFPEMSSSVENAEPMVFRLYDPRIFAAFQQTAKSLEKSRLFGPCQRIWCWIAQETQWKAFEPETTIEEAIWLQSPFVLNQTHLDILSELKINHLISQLNQHVQHYFPHLFPQEDTQEDFARFLYKESITLGFESQQSIFYFANIWCYLGKACLEKEHYPDIAALLIEPSLQTPQQRIQAAALQLANHQPNLTHRVADYIC
jgi:hypothetical protein